MLRLFVSKDHSLGRHILALIYSRHDCFECRSAGKMGSSPFRNGWIQFSLWMTLDSVQKAQKIVGRHAWILPQNQECRPSMQQVSKCMWFHQPDSWETSLSELLPGQLPGYMWTPSHSCSEGCRCDLWSLWSNSTCFSVPQSNVGLKAALWWKDLCLRENTSHNINFICAEQLWLFLSTSFNSND